MNQKSAFKILQYAKIAKEYTIRKLDMLKSILIAALLAIILKNNALAASKDVCQVRANFVEAIAAERDKGTKRELTVKLVRNKLPAAADTSSLQAYVELIYSQPMINPQSFKEISLKQCMKSLR